MNADSGSALAPWRVYEGAWSCEGGLLQGSSRPPGYGRCFLTNSWDAYSVEASIQFPNAGYGGGLGGRLDATNGAHYAAWVFPQGSGGTNVLKLIKFYNWNTWGYGGIPYAPMTNMNLPPVGSDWHSLKLTFVTNHIAVDYDGTNMISMLDTEAQWHTNGGVCLDQWTESAVYNMSVTNLAVKQEN